MNMSNSSLEVSETLNSGTENLAAKLLTLGDYLWQEQAACSGKKDLPFFPDRGASTKTAKALCAECPVQVECLEFAIAKSIGHGVWGGKSERERRMIKQERKLSAQILDIAS